MEKLENRFNHACFADARLRGKKGGESTEENEEYIPHKFTVTAVVWNAGICYST